ncbi:uncharacterized protein [Aristolochia californica]|uniref:uncharacterized protein n=1 Tax=Aristolochia californica TaxID=171875 RepID=UPI0035D7E714
MSSDLFLLDGSFFRHSPELVSTDFDLFADPFFPFSESPPDALHPSSNATTQLLPCGDAFVAAPSLAHLSSSPPSHLMHGLSLEPSVATQPSSNGVLNLSGLDTSDGVKLEGFDSLPFRLDKTSLMQRSFSSHSLDRKPSLLFHPHFSSLSESAEITKQVTNSNENCGFGGPIRRSSSTGDLQRLNIMQPTQSSPSPLSHESLCMEEARFKVGRYSAEERKQRIHRYRSKRTQRNFNKTIKYACRKTLADSRPRVRGRFARNDEAGEIPKVATCHREEEDEEGLWMDAFQEEEEEMAGGGVFSTSFGGQSQFQYFSF